MQYVTDMIHFRNVLSHMKIRQKVTKDFREQYMNIRTLQIVLFNFKLRNM